MHIYDMHLLYTYVFVITILIILGLHHIYLVCKTISYIISLLFYVY